MVFDFGGRPRPFGPERAGSPGPAPGASGATRMRRPVGRPWWLGPAAVIGALVLLFVLLTSDGRVSGRTSGGFRASGSATCLLTRYAAVALSFLVGFAVAALFVGINLWAALRSEGGIGLTVGDVTIGRRLSIVALIGATVVLERVVRPLRRVGVGTLPPLPQSHLVRRDRPAVPSGCLLLCLHAAGARVLALVADVADRADRDRRCGGLCGETRHGTDGRHASGCRRICARISPSSA